MENRNELPTALRPWSAQIEATRRPYIAVQATDRPPASPTQSRLGGRPYWPADLDYPTGINEAPLYLLAQINFAEVPSLPPLPETGLLQIFIAGDPLYGMDYQLPQWQGDFRVVYHAEMLEEDASLQDFSFLPPPEDFPMPPRKSFALEFSLSDGPAPADDPQFIEQLGEHFWKQFGDERWKIQADYRKYAQASGHKLGGYPHFPQEDPREPGQTPFLLLQLDSDTHAGLNWGDRGTAHFFVAAGDLVDRDFSRVFYSWSCY